MGQPVIVVENLGKKYSLRHLSNQGEGFRHMLERTLYAPARWLRSRGLPGMPAAEKANPNIEEFWAVRDMSFSIEPGDVVGVVGRNGAGKSTLLKILSRITEPTEGRVRIRGRVASLLEVGTGFHYELTGRENIFLNGTILGMTRREIKKKFDEIVAFAEVDRFLDTPVKHYSSGMYVRLAFSVAAHLEPEILIVDEVLAVGDAQFQKKCLGKMQEVSEKEGRTVLFVSHNMAAVSTLTKRVLLLNRGRLEFSGESRDGISLYLSSGADEDSVFAKEAKGDDPSVTRVEIFCSESSKTHDSGKPFRVRIRLHVPKSNPELCLRFHIATQYQTPVAMFAAYDQPGFTLIQGSGEVEVECVIPHLDLNIGNYALKVMLFEPGWGYENIEGICPFEVVILERTTRFGWKTDQGTVLMPGTWSHT